MGRPPCHVEGCNGWLQMVAVETVCVECGESPVKTIAQGRIDRALELCNQQYEYADTPLRAICEFAVRLGAIRAALQGKDSDDKDRTAGD